MQVFAKAPSRLSSIKILHGCHLSRKLKLQKSINFSHEYHALLFFNHFPCRLLVNSYLSCIKRKVYENACHSLVTNKDFTLDWFMIIWSFWELIFRRSFKLSFRLVSKKYFLKIKINTLNAEFVFKNFFLEVIHCRRLLGWKHLI